MSVKVSRENLDSIKTAFSIKNFIADLPRMLNTVFTTVADCITDFYNPAENKINCAEVECGVLKATTVIAQNITFKGSNGELYKYEDIGTILSELENRLDAIMPISKEQIDALDSSSLITVKTTSEESEQ